MRKFIDIVENVRKMEPSDYAQQGTVINPTRDRNHITGPYSEDMTPEEARQYLDTYPNGALMHEWFETDAFVTRDQHGNYIFYDPNLRRENKPYIEDWSWDFLEEIRNSTQEGDPDIDAGWWYASGEELAYDYSPEWWDKIKSGEMTPSAQRYL